VYQQLRPRFPNLRLILVPRQRERFDEVAQMLRSRPVEFMRRSELGCHAHGFAWACSPTMPTQSRGPGTQGEVPAGAVILLDTIGELSAAWGLADIAFVGGSLDGRRGGQNMIEPAAYGAAVLFGPHTWNFRDTVERLLAANAAVVVRDAAEMEAAVTRLLEDPAERARLGDAARQLVREQQGATQRTLDMLDDFLPHQFAAAIAS
jgi:3-deoxy-D-manno-octulosonic-acid transferase